MADDGSVTDDEISGFKSLQEAMAIGFERQNAEFRSMFGEFRSEIRSEIRFEISLVRADVSALEHRMLRRFDDVDERIDRLETHARRVNAHLGLGEL